MLESKIKIMVNICSKCDKHVYCKGMCHACYSKEQRNTETGKERMKAYNMSAGKEAQRRFREKNKTPKLPTPPCECGKESVAKNLCITCYQKYYQQKKNGWKSRRKSKIDSEIIFKKVLAEVKKGMSIEKACKVAKIHRSTLYRVISPALKSELNFYKKLGFIDDDL